MGTQESQANHGSEAFVSVCSQLTVDQLRFITARLNESTDKGAAKAVGVKPDTVTYWKRSGAPIDEAVRLLALDGVVLAKEILRRSVAEAAAVKRAGLRSGDERVKQAASTDIMDRELGRARQPLDHGGEVRHEIVMVDWDDANNSES